ncbi:sugar ABC transporter ATP-binding protein [Acidovorax sp. Leaf160]|uniref:sugar ABC transporter ATP-binding protein n=1 Tax=Acidovorax sp. Leaf160 TaxID=1736280 RepID=UPI0006FAB192|nr:sugar ABC transporter ATP-binding protein [Acidovorax sp. Leaf160]KQR43166.1 sugar ABC transporter ATP-binding protein [Acidovorax sp. Leaf160]
MNSAAATPTPQPVMRLDGLSKRFGGTLAVDGVSLDLYAGEVLALLGENGAGKSTLIKMLAGVYAADSGSIELLGQAEAQWRAKPKDSQGIAFIHQDLGLVEWMTVAENIAIGMGFPRRRGLGFGLIDWKAVNERARRVLAHVGCDIDPLRRVFTLSRAEKSLLAIGRALDTQARVLVLDEPTASLPMSDVQRLFTVLRRLREGGVAMVYVSHRLDEIMELSDRAAVMRDGRLVGVRSTAQSSTAELVELIVGRKMEGVSAKARVPAADAPEVLRLNGLCSANAGPVSFAARRGEVLGLIGLRGAGHEAVSRALFGLSDIAKGSIHLLARRYHARTPDEAIAAGVALVAADRLEENLGPALSVQENLFPNPALTQGSLLTRRRPDQEAATARELIQRFDVNPPAPHADVQNLSGGNQQKVVLARWMHLAKPLLILEEPTAGVDVGAKHQIYELLRQQAEAGICVLVVSTDFEEVAKVCTRALVFRSGQVASELMGEQLGIAQLLTASAGEMPAPMAPEALAV